MVGRDTMIKYLVIWTAVTMFQVPCPDRPEGKDKYGIEQGVVSSCAVLHMGSKTENKYQIFTSTQEFHDFMLGMKTECFGLGGYCRDVEVYDISKSTPIMKSFKTNP